MSKLDIKKKITKMNQSNKAKKNYHQRKYNI